MNKICAVCSNALKPYQFNRQFPEEIEQVRKKPIPYYEGLQKKWGQSEIKLVRNILYINGKPTSQRMNMSRVPLPHLTGVHIFQGVSKKRVGVSSTPDSR